MKYEDYLQDQISKKVGLGLIEDTYVYKKNKKGDLKQSVPLCCGKVFLSEFTSALSPFLFNSP